MRLFNQRWEQVRLHAHLQPGQFDKVLGLGGGTGPWFGIGQATEEA